MNMRECERLKTGAMVTEAYGIAGSDPLGIVLHKEYIEEDHYCKTLGGKKKARYDVWVHWIETPWQLRNKPNPIKLQCWEVKLLKNG